MPRRLVAEIIDGVLHTHPRPAKPHAAAATALGEELGPPFKRGRGGPGGWILLFEPELHLAADVIVPDLAGWRRERMPKLGDDAYFTLAPDWACEVLSRQTAKVDRSQKLPMYAREGVGHVWLVDPIARTLEVLRRQGQNWLLMGGTSVALMQNMASMSAMGSGSAIVFAVLRPKQAPGAPQKF